jgi:NTP pyrophosphatase (non-canonical NTP hydrolase)
VAGSGAGDGSVNVDSELRKRVEQIKSSPVQLYREAGDYSNRELVEGILVSPDDIAAIEAVAREHGDGLTFARFAATNLKRCESPEGFHHALSAWSLSDWFTAAMGELGEAANKAKKLNRVRDGITGNTETVAELRTGLADEIADSVIYLDLLAQAAGFDLETAIVSKFDRTSERIGSPERLGSEAEAANHRMVQPDHYQRWER